jgi:hypothetical protein
MLHVRVSAGMLGAGVCWLRLHAPLQRCGAQLQRGMQHRPTRPKPRPRPRLQPLPRAGIYRGMPLRVNPRQRAYYALYKTYIDIIHIGRDETAQMFTGQQVGRWRRCVLWVPGVGCACTCSSSSTPTPAAQSATAVIPSRAPSPRQGAGAEDVGGSQGMDDSQALPMPDSEEPAVHVLGNMSREELAAKERELRVRALALGWAGAGWLAGWLAG